MSRLGAVVLLLVLAANVPISAVVAADFSYPATRAGEIAEEFFIAFNSRDRGVLREFTETYRSEESLARRSMEERLNQYEQLRGMLGDLEPGGILEEGANKLVIAARAVDMRGWLSIGFQLEDDPPYKLESLEMRPTQDPTGPGLDFTGLASLEAMLEHAVEVSGIPAIAAALVDEDGIVESAAVGVRVIGSEEKVQIDDRFHVGSVTKSMTATVIGALVETAVLDMDRTLSKLLPDVEMREEYRAVTLRELLGHRGGVPAYLLLSAAQMAELDALPGSPREQRAALTVRVLNQPPESEPSKTFSYSNAGYTVAAHISEAVSGESWEQLLQEHVFKPLKMRSAGTGWPVSLDRTDEPRGHYGSPKSELQPQPVDDPYRLGAYLAPAGDVHCSVEDLALFAQLHLRGLRGKDTYLKAETIRRLHAPAEDWEGQAYAGGWMVGRGEGDPVHWHNGSAGTFFSLVEVDPEAGVAAVVLMNSGDLGNETIARRIAEECSSRYATR